MNNEMSKNTMINIEPIVFKVAETNSVTHDNG